MVLVTGLRLTGVARSGEKPNIIVYFADDISDREIPEETKAKSEEKVSVGGPFFVAPLSKGELCVE